MIRTLWITDPWITLDYPRETTLRLMEAGLQAGHEVYWADVKTLRMEGSTVRIDACRLLTNRPERRSEDFIFEGPRAMEPREFSGIHYRLDPPVDLPYLHELQMLALSLEGSSTELINPAGVIFATNEKFESAAFGDLLPPQIISSEKERLLHFLKRHPDCVLKPLNAAGSKGIRRVGPADEDALREATENYKQPIQLQTFLKGIHEYELRSLFIDGELWGVTRKKVSPDNFLVDIDAGTPVLKAEATREEMKTLDRIGRRLRAHGVRFAAIDMIDGFVTDYNVTSPGLVVQMENALGVDLASRLVERLSRPMEA